MSQETILIVDDHPANLAILFQALEMAGFKVLINADGETAIKSAAQAQPDLILLDVMMPGINGFETCRRLKADDATRDIPVIFMTALSESIDEITGLRIGAVDYITKPFQVEIVLARVKTHLALRQAQQVLKESNAQLQQEIAERTQAENALQQANDDLKALITELSGLNQISRTLMVTPDVSTVLTSVIRQIGHLLQAHDAFIALLANDLQNLVVAAQYVSTEDHPDLLNRRLPYDPYIAKAIEHGQSLVLSLASDTSRFGSHRQPMLAQGITFVMIVPLHVRRKLLGMMNLSISQPGREFTSSDVNLVETIARQLASVIENARLFKQESHQRQVAESLREVAQILNSSLDLKSVFDKLFEQLGRVIAFDSSAVFLHQGQDLALLNASQKAKIFMGRKITLDSHDPAAQVFLQQRSWILADVRSHPDWEIWPGGEAIRSWMGVPLLLGERAIGVLTADSYRVDAYEESDAHLLQMFADHSAIAIQNAQLFDDAHSAREEAEEARRAAEIANRAKSEFLANMSHEIRTPMNAILGFTELLEQHITDQQQKGYLDSITSAGQSLLTLINDILDLSKVEAGKLEVRPEPVHLKAMIREVSQIFHINVQQKALKYLIDIAEDVPDTLVLDGVRIRQILFNLIGNAIKFTERGQITLKVRGTVPKDRQPNAIDLVLHVEDTGIGIAEHQQARIFDAFTQQDGQNLRKYGGTGLGLAITKRLVEIMGGSITLTSQVDRGTCFTILLPQVPVNSIEPVEKPEESRETLHVVFEEGTILIVDDVASNRLLMKEFLRHSGLNVIEAEDGSQALHVLQTSCPDMILLDLKMPVMNGYDVIERIRSIEELCQMPVVALTATTLKSDKDIGISRGFDGYLQKPVRRTELLREIARFLPHTLHSTAPSNQSDVEEPANSPASALLLENTPEDLSELIELLENGCFTQWQAARKSGSFEEIEAFGLLLQQLGEQYALHRLQELGSTLVAQVRNFDVEHISATLEAYSAIVEDVRKDKRNT